jgi:hypothetical protein
MLDLNLTDISEIEDKGLVNTEIGRFQVAGDESKAGKKNQLVGH